MANGNGNVANNGGKWITRKRRKAIYARDNFECVYCLKGLLDGVVLTIDHVVAQELGGDNSSGNLVTACKTCNSSKASKSMRKFYSVLRGRGVNTDEIGNRVRRNTKRKLVGTFRI